MVLQVFARLRVGVPLQKREHAGFRSAVEVFRKPLKNRRDPEDGFPSVQAVLPLAFSVAARADPATGLFVQLPVQRVTRERLRPQPRAARCTADQGRMDARIGESLAQDPVFDLVQGADLAGDSVRLLPEDVLPEKRGVRNGLGQSFVEQGLNRDRVVGVDPERLALGIGAQCVRLDLTERSDVVPERTGPVRADGLVIDPSRLAYRGLEQAGPGGVVHGCLGRAAECRGDEQRGRQDGGDAAGPGGHRDVLRYEGRRVAVLVCRCSLLVVAFRLRGLCRESDAASMRGYPRPGFGKPEKRERRWRVSGSGRGRGSAPTAGVPVLLVQVRAWIVAVAGSRPDSHSARSTMVPVSSRRERRTAMAWP